MMNRRELLAALVLTPPILALQTNTLFAHTSNRSAILNVSEALTGRSPLDPEIAMRVERILTKHDETFPSRLAKLASAIGAAQARDRDHTIASLSDENIDTAIEIIRPWYLGFTGTPSTSHMEDDAEFVTFLSALMYEPTKDNTVRPSYARDGRDYWAQTPAGVEPPNMDPNIREWGDKSPKAAATYASADPAYLILVQGRAKTLSEAETMLKNEADQTNEGATSKGAVQ